MKLEEFLTLTQEQLFKMLCKKYDGKSIFCKGDFIFVKGDAPVMLVAHLDTVHSETVKTICRSDDNNILMSPEGIGGDDRCGVYALVKAYEQCAVKPCLLFTCNEEVGGVGADMFCQLYRQNKFPPLFDKLKMIVEIDRRGSNDAVYYDCHNTQFENYITSKGFVTAHGSFSDISLIAPELGLAAVNLSSGYYNAHTQHEFINRSELETVIKKVVEMVGDSVRANFPKFEYAEKIFGLSRFNDFDDFYDDFYIEVSPENDQLYEELLDVYDADELNDLISQHGEGVLKDLYKSCYGLWITDFDEK